MKDQFTNNINQEDAELVRKLQAVVENTNVDPHFLVELENKLKETHQPKVTWTMPGFKKITPAVGWVALVIMFGLALSWSIRNLIPAQQPGSGATPDGFVCPITEPNGSLPPGATAESPYFFGNGNLWTLLTPNGKIYMLPEHQQPDGSYGSKWPFWRGVPGTLTIEGHRLDAQAKPLRTDIAEGFGNIGFQGVGLIFPATGCWEVTARVGESSLTFVVEVVFGEATPTPDLSPTRDTTTSENPTPAPADGGYSWRGTKLYLNQPLPQSPTEAKLYTLKLNQPVTKDDVLMLAQRFGIQGEAQELPPDFSNGIGYLLADGKQKLEVQSNNHFVFYTNFRAAALEIVSEEQARTAIDGFLKKYGFNFEYRVASAPGASAQQYVITPLTPDGSEIRSDYLMPISYEVTIDGTGQIFAFSGFLLDYETIGTFQLITAEEAFQSVLNDNPQFGRMESVRGKGGGGGGGPGFYKLNLSGTPVPFPTAGTQQNNASGYAYTVVAGDTCRSIANTFKISIDDLIAMNNLPEDCSTLTIDQMLIIPPAKSTSDNPYIGKQFEDQRGIFTVNLYRQPDGSLRKEYGFITTKDDENFNLKLEGAGLQELEQYNNLPIDIWGTITSVDEFGNMTANVERYTIPFPSLRIQIFQGQQQVTQIDGKSAVLFTTSDGTTYIQAILNGNPFNDDSVIGREGDQVLLEGFNIPGEFNNGYPVLRIFGGSIANAKDGSMSEITVTADQPNIYDEAPNAEAVIPPTATVEKAELVYYLPNLQSGNTNPGTDAKYIQPAWRFYGHYNTGDEFEILIQALQREFLLPQLAPYTPPG